MLNAKAEKNGSGYRIDMDFGTHVHVMPAENDRGENQSQGLELTVTGTRSAQPSPAASPEPSAAPSIAYFRLDETKREGDITFHTLCFRVWNAEQVEVQPAAFPASKVFQGCFAVAPRRETTYTLTARGKDGAEVSKQLTLAP